MDNLTTLSEPGYVGYHVGGFAPGGESAAHRRLKLYVASHGLEFGLSDRAIPSVEHPFLTGDRVDVLFTNHWPERTVIEVEVDGETNICVGIHQAVKYRSLAEIDAGYPLLTPKVRASVVAYDTHYQRAEDLAGRYDISLFSVERDRVLASAV